MTAIFEVLWSKELSHKLAINTGRSLPVSVTSQCLMNTFLWFPQLNVITSSSHEGWKSLEKGFKRMFIKDISYLSIFPSNSHHFFHYTWGKWCAINEKSWKNASQCFFVSVRVHQSKFLITRPWKEKKKSLPSDDYPERIATFFVFIFQFPFFYVALEPVKVY
jgi:hypothetical protein